MKLDILFLVCAGYFMHTSDAKGHEKDVHLKIHVPDLVHQHNHKHTIFKKSPSINNGRYESKFVAGHGSPKDNILVDDYHHPHEHGYKYEDKPYPKHSAKQKPSKKHNYNKNNKEDDDDFKKYLDNLEAKPDKFNDHDDFNVGPVFKKTGKSVHTEHYEVKKINPDAKFPDEKYIIKGSYKVQETDPFFDFTTTAVHAYDDPISKIAAKILTNYDYTNFDPHSDERGSADFLDSEEKDHASVEDYDRGSYSNNPINYDKYGAKKEKVHDYTNIYPDNGNYNHNYAEKEQVNDFNAYPSYGNKDAKKQKVHVYSDVHPNNGKYEDSDAGKEVVRNYNNGYPSHGKYENDGDNKGIVHVFSSGKYDDISAGKKRVPDYINTDPSNGKYKNDDGRQKKIHIHVNSFPSNEKYVDYKTDNKGYDVTSALPSKKEYDNYGDTRGSINGYSSVTPNQGKYKKEYDNYGDTRGTINGYSSVNPNQGKHNDEHNDKIQDHAINHLIQGKNNNYDVVAEIFDDHSSIHPNPEKSTDYSTKKTVTPEYILHPSYAQLILTEPHLPEPHVDYYVNSNYGEVESTPGVYDYVHPYYGHKELEYFVNPHHGDDLYGADWQDHIRRTVYGNDYAASSPFASRILPENTEKPQ